MSELGARQRRMSGCSGGGWACGWFVHPAGACRERPGLEGGARMAKREAEASIYSLAEVWELAREVPVLCKVAPALSLGGTHHDPPL